MATYKDIQRMTGLSLSTISKYYNGRTVLEENRSAIEAAAKSLGFRINGFARNLRAQRSRTVGVLLPELNNEFHLSIIDGVERALRKENISVLVSSGYLVEDAQDDPVELMMSKMVDGVITVPPPGLADSLRAVVDRGVPVVQMDLVIEDLRADAVVLDNRDAAAMAARHLIDHGHRRIGFLGGLDSYSAVRERRQGFILTCQERGLEVDERFITATELTVDEGYAAANRILRFVDRPTALIASNYDLTVGALIALNESGLRIPHDISFVGFDSRELARVSKPPLTMVIQPIAKIAAEAARLISSRLQGGTTLDPVVIELPAELIVGSSVASLHD